jgi:DtxR family transcriptional regulator, Mn-dependent transcriptional regulator
MPSKLSPAAEDYVKALYSLESEGGPPGAEPAVNTTALAARLDVSAASATNMIKKLESLGVVAYAPYKGASLTEAGRRIALEIVRHHRLIETYLAQALGVPWDQVHAEAEVLEHALSEELEERISAHLGHPTSDPHGHPIPTKEGDLPGAAPGSRRLWELGEGDAASIERVPDSEAETLRYLDELGMRPGARVEVVGRGPVEGPLFLRLTGREDEVRALSKELAESVWVS